LAGGRAPARPTRKRREIVAVLDALQRLVRERVEDELAGDAEHVERGGPVLGDEATGRLEILAQPDPLGVVAPELRVLMQAAEVLDDLVLVGAVLADPKADGELGNAVAHVRVGELGEEVRRLHDVGVGVVDHPLLHQVPPLSVRDRSSRGGPPARRARPTAVQGACRPVPRSARG
jgi:hypothetical protein